MTTNVKDPHKQVVMSSGHAWLDWLDSLLDDVIDDVIVTV